MAGRAQKTEIDSWLEISEMPCKCGISFIAIKTLWCDNFQSDSSVIRLGLNCYKIDVAYKERTSE